MPSHGPFSAATIAILQESDGTAERSPYQTRRGILAPCAVVVALLDEWAKQVSAGPMPEIWKK